MRQGIDSGIFILCLLAAISAECVPLMVALTAAAGGLTLVKEVLL